MECGEEEGRRGWERRVNLLEQYVIQNANIAGLAFGTDVNIFGSRLLFFLTRP